MTGHLSLVQGESRAAPAFVSPPFQLSDRAQRPGELADIVRVALSAAAAAQLVTLATRARLPLALLAVIVTEAEQGFAEAAEIGADAEALTRALDTAAAADARAFDPRPARALRAYAAALRSGGERPSPSTSLELVVPDRLRARWSLAAQEAGLTLGAWISTQVERAQPGRELWEARAADEGRTLSEWLARQALLRRRRLSSSAHATASG